MTVKEILERYKSVAVVGLSSSRDRDSYSVSRYMQAQGYRITPVNPNESDVLGERSYKSLEDVSHEIEIVNVFRRPEFVPQLMETAIKIQAKVVWLQEGVIHEEAARRGKDCGLEVIMDRCILKEHMALSGP